MEMNENTSEKLVTVSGKYTFRIGEMFPSYEELEKRLELHCSESFVYYWRRDTRTVKGAHTKTSRPIASRLKYYSLRYACVFGGEKKKSRSRGKRHNNKSLRNDCPSFIMLRASKDGKDLEVVGVNNEHNHDCSSAVNENLPHQRKLPEDLKQEVVEMMLLHIDRKKIIEYVKKKTNKSITVKDLFNLKAKYKNFNFKLERSKEEILESMGLSPSTDERYENDGIMDDESKEWMGLCYDENVIEYDEYSDCPDDGNVEIDVEVHPEHLLEYTECDIAQLETIDATDLQVYKFEQDCNTSDNEQNLVIEVSPATETASPSQECNLSDSADQNQQGNQSLRTLRLKCFIQRENNRLKRKIINCRICGTHPRFLDMQIRVLKAEKQKLLEEMTILRLAKEKLFNEVALSQSNLVVE
ncbi:uncharacterized protein LOC119078304 [Bradysia coprophila]|uniref:uncharacterized protein LOC119078304 n=1 Tax=Bradysia coprophila TaxID=38358 RepID=UPI00187DCEEE|nr:uncharacterized protein LOC119078304 [Bradysia coprophila]